MGKWDREKIGKRIELGVGGSKRGGDRKKKRRKNYLRLRNRQWRTPFVTNPNLPRDLRSTFNIPKIQRQTANREPPPLAITNRHLRNGWF